MGINIMRKLKLIALCLATVALAACSKSDMASTDSALGSTTGIGGSFARFAIVGDHLYTVDNRTLHHYSLNNPEKPVFSNNIELMQGIETIFPKGELLFIGSNDGMYIFDASNAYAPQQISHYRHITSCDPVVANDDYAYVTLHTTNDSRCGPNNINELQILDISNLASPQLVERIPMMQPKGLGLAANDLLAICDDGLKLYDRSNPTQPVLVHSEKIDAYDVIPQEDRLLVIGDQGLYQYKLIGQEAKLLSKMTIYPKQ